MCSALAHLAHCSCEHQPRTRDASLPGTIRLYRLLAQQALHENCTEIASFRHAPVHICLATCGKAQAISPHATHGYCRVVVQCSRKHNTAHSLLLRPRGRFLTGRATAPCGRTNSPFGAVLPSTQARDVPVRLRRRRRDRTDWRYAGPRKPAPALRRGLGCGWRDTRQPRPPPPRRVIPARGREGAAHGEPPKGVGRPCPGRVKGGRVAPPPRKRPRRASGGPPASPRGGRRPPPESRCRAASRRLICFLPPPRGWTWH